jgi:hypothetical protein
MNRCAAEKKKSKSRKTEIDFSNPDICRLIEAWGVIHLSLQKKSLGSSLERYLGYPINKLGIFEIQESPYHDLLS